MYNKEKTVEVNMGGWSTAEERQRALDLRLSGMTYKEVSEALGNRSVAWVRNVCVQNGADGTDPWKGKKQEPLREYKRQGHTAKEVSEKFGVSYEYAKKVCSGIEPQRGRGNQYTSNGFDCEENAKRIIEERTPWFEYAGGFTGVDDGVYLRCKVCGHVQWRSMITVRARGTTCEKCREKQEQARAKRKEQERLARKAQNKEWHKAVALRREQRQKEHADWLEARKHPCSVCGKETTNKYCCSTECAIKRNNGIKEVKRRAKIKESLVDKDITIQSLYDRDSGICYICGGLCDWADAERINGTIICGDTYPSIDHVMPLAKGGVHSWENVRLAHRRCNYLKKDKIIGSPGVAV